MIDQSCASPRNTQVTSTHNKKNTDGGAAFLCNHHRGSTLQPVFMCWTPPKILQSWTTVDTWYPLQCYREKWTVRRRMNTARPNGLPSITHVAILLCPCYMHNIRWHPLFFPQVPAVPTQFCGDWFKKVKCGPFNMVPVLSPKSCCRFSRSNLTLSIWYQFSHYHLLEV